jgi:hypothetical protein
MDTFMFWADVSMRNLNDSKMRLFIDMLPITRAIKDVAESDDDEE